jgi:hypothetical protein
MDEALEDILERSYLGGWRIFCLGSPGKVIVWDAQTEFLAVTVPGLLAGSAERPKEQLSRTSASPAGRGA